MTSPTEFIIQEIQTTTTTAGLVGPSGPAGAPEGFGQAFHGVKAWTYSPSDQSLGASLLSVAGSAGRLACIKMYSENGGSATQVQFYLSVAGSSLTAGQNFIGIYSAAGALLSQTADLTATGYVGAARVVTENLTTPVALTPGLFVFIAFLYNGTTPPTIGRGASVSSALNNLNIAAGLSSRVVLANSSITTTLPGTLSGFTSGTVSWWGAIK